MAVAAYLVGNGGVMSMTLSMAKDGALKVVRVDSCIKSRQKGVSGALLR